MKRLLNIITNYWFQLLGLVAIGILALAVATQAKTFATYPDDFIPFWSSARGGVETGLLNTAQIVRIIPVFDPEEDKLSHKNILHLNVTLVDGTTLQVVEEFEEFYSRVRKAQAR